MSGSGMDLERPLLSTVTGFDYSTLPPETARHASAAAEAIRSSMLRTGQEVGRRLLDIKEILPHGAFVDWCKKALNITPRSAQNYMNAAKWLDGKSETLSLLPATVIYELSAPSAPAEVVREVVAAAEAGALPEADLISHKIEVARAEKRAVKDEEKAVKQAMAKKPDRTEDDVRRSIAQQRAKKARADEKQRQEILQEKAEREARRERQRAAAQSLVAAHREVVAAVVEAVEGDAYHFIDFLKDALKAASGGER